VLAVKFSLIPCEIITPSALTSSIGSCTLNTISVQYFLGSTTSTGSGTNPSPPSPGFAWRRDKDVNKAVIPSRCPTFLITTEQWVRARAPHPAHAAEDQGQLQHEPRRSGARSHAARSLQRSSESDENSRRSDFSEFEPHFICPRSFAQGSRVNTGATKE